MDRLTLINQCFEKKVLLNRDLLELDDAEKILGKMNSLTSQKMFLTLLILNKDNFFLLEQFSELPDLPDGLLELDKYRVGFEKNQEPEPYLSFLIDLKQKLVQKHPQNLYPSSVLVSYQSIPQKYKVKDFTKLFISRYKFIENLLRNRPELTNTLSISKILDKKEKETVSLIGLVSEINQAKTGNIILALEDLTGQIKVIINKNKAELCALAEDLVPDEVIGLTGTNKEKIVFAENIIWPEVPADRVLKKYSEEIYAIFLSDIHVGSANFLAEEFNKFLSWLTGETGTPQQKEIAQKVKYIFIAGDLVDGVGVYPDQDKELAIKDIYQQYQAAADLLKKIPSYLQIIICPGNHDALHLAEPQPAFNPKYIQPLLQLPNVTLVGNPALINICQANGFPGFEVLLYHGYSFDYYVNSVDSLRNSGGYSRADLIMKFLLKKRHLAPAFTSTPYLPVPDDCLLIKKIPDFFITGHIHYAMAANYRNITMVSGSCWQSKTSFQEKVGHEPQPARVPVVNLKTREIKLLKFI